jgi:hypothetical protein
VAAEHGRLADAFVGDLAVDEVRTRRFLDGEWDL